MAHFLISILCWLGLSVILGKIAVKYESGSEKEKNDFVWIILNGLGASIAFVFVLGIILGILSWISPAIDSFSDILFSTLNPFGNSEE